jgi:transposase-like protein
MSAPRLSVSAKRAIVKAYHTGEPIKEIARTFGVHPSYPGRLAKRYGVAPPKGVRVILPSTSKRTKLTPYLCAKALEMYQGGKDLPDIALAMRCSFALAARALAEAVEAERIEDTRCQS